jgi:hypothetical protein
MTIDEAREHIGAGVVYNPGHGALEDGTIVRVSESWVHVRYGHQTITKATAAAQLTLLAPDIGDGVTNPDDRVREIECNLCEKSLAPLTPDDPMYNVSCMWVCDDCFD